MSSFQKASEEELIQAFAFEETREVAFEEVVRRYYSQVRRWIYRWVQSPEIADELTQETFLAAWEKLHTFRGEAKLSTWLYTIARRKAFAYLRKDPVRQWIPWPTMEEGEVWDPAAEADVPYERLFRELEAVQATLTPIQQKVYRAVWEEGRPYNDIASELGLRPNTIKAHVHHIRQRLWKFLRPWLGED
jgi:RNA polymerase sigma-70 factor (ECF subfamily)